MGLPVADRSISASPRDQHLHGEEFREHQILARGIACFPAFREMDCANGFRSRAAHQIVRRDRFPSCIRNFLQDAIKDAAQGTLRKTFCRRIDWRDAPEMDRYLFIVLDHLEFRMIHAHSFSAQSRFAKNNDPLTSGDHLLYVM